MLNVFLCRYISMVYKKGEQANLVRNNTTKAIEAVRKKEMGLKRASKQGADDDPTASMQTERRC